MKVLVCGGRDFGKSPTLFPPGPECILAQERYARDKALLWGELDALDAGAGRVSEVIHGGASGADSLAHYWGLEREVRTVTFNADWKNQGKAAGPLRNQRMLAEGRPDLVLAAPGGKGTADMVRRARAAGVEVKELKHAS
jgi:hypothetical protein